MGLILPETLRRRSAGLWWASLHAGVAAERDRLDLVDELLERGLDDDRLIAMFVAGRVPMEQLRSVVAERLGWPLPTEAEAAEVLAGAFSETWSEPGSCGRYAATQIYALYVAADYSSRKLGDLCGDLEIALWAMGDGRESRGLRKIAEEAGVVQDLERFEAACAWPA